MEEKYPILSEGALVGELTVTREGLMTVFDANCRMADGIVRLSVYGAGNEGYLGVMAPSEGRLRLRKVLSPNAMKAMPGVIEEVAFSGRSAISVIETEEPETEETEARGTEASEIEPTEAAEVFEQTQEPNVEAQQAETQQAEEAAQVEEAAQETNAPQKDTYWYPSSDGALVSYDGDKSLIAFPAGDSRVPDYITPIEKTIEGKDYWVYVTKDGRIIN